MFACKASTPVTEIRPFSHRSNKCLDQYHTRFSFYRTITFSSSTHHLAALLLCKAISILPSDDFLETIFMRAVAIWYAISNSSESRLRNRNDSSATLCVMCLSLGWGCTGICTGISGQARTGCCGLCKRGWKTCWFLASANKLTLVWIWKLCWVWVVGCCALKGSSVASVTFGFYSY